MSSLNKIINLIKKTRNRCFIINPDSEDVLVILTLEEYEKLLKRKSEEDLLTESKLLDKINRDIALKISEEKNLTEADVRGEETFGEIPKETDGVLDEEEKFYFEPVE